MAPNLRRKIPQIQSEAASIDLMGAGAPGRLGSQRIIIDDDKLLKQLETECRRHLALYDRFYTETYGARSPAHLEKFIQNAKAEKGTFWDSFGVASLALLKEAGAGRGVRVLSLGSGIGTVETAAARILGADVTGIEYDRDYATVAKRAADWFKANGLTEGGLNLLQGDFLEHDLKGYDILYYFQLGTSDPKALEEKVLRGLKKGGRFVVYQYENRKGYGFPKLAEKSNLTKVDVKEGGLTLHAGAIFTHK